MVRGLPLLAFFLLGLGSDAAFSIAQEPAFIAWRPAVRFEENPGYFHYIIPCWTAKESGEQTASQPAWSPRDPALCWPVQAVNMIKMEGKFEGSPQAAGQLIVSASHVQFVPRDPKQSGLSADFKPSEVTFQHEAGKTFGFFGAKDHFYKFLFSDICETCTPGTPAPPDLNTVQLESEFSLVQESFKQFDPVYKRIKEISALVQVEALPANQPAESDPSGAMGLYGRINTQLAERCPEPAKSCIESYAKYQTCLSGDQPGQNCGAKPECTAECKISREDAQRMNAALCVQWEKSEITLVPDWSELLRKKAPQGTIRPFHPGGFDLQVPNTASKLPSNGCGVKDTYTRASTPLAPASGFGVAGMEGLGGGGAPGAFAGSMNTPKIKAAAPNQVAISAGVAQGLMLEKVVPVYPQVAKAAHVSGTVILQATISKAGEITELRVVSGPDLLQQAAMDAVKQWRYRPYLLNGEPVEVLTTINVVFTLGGSAAPAAPAPSAPAPPSQP